jgi:hypothetical protein
MNDEVDLPSQQGLAKSGGEDACCANLVYGNVDLISDGVNTD